MEGRFHKYGINWDKCYEKKQIYIEFILFRDLKGAKRIPHFKNIVSVLWPDKPGSAKRFFFHPWADKMLEAACKWNYLSVMGAGSSGKSDFFAVWAIVNYIVAPESTMVLVTSTTLKDARKRIWGAICDYWLACPGLPGKLLNSQGMIRLQVGNEFSERCGITLIAGAPTKAAEAVGKIIGFKNKRVIFVADELPELSEAILEAALTNLSLNPFFQLIGLGNPKNHFDPMSRMTIPKDRNWESINVDTGEWETELGYNLHFDGMKSPNVEAGRDLYPGIIGPSKIEEAIKRVGAASSGFWRMIRGFYCPAGEDDCVYSDVQLQSSGAFQTLGNGFSWLDNDLTPVAALDPSYTNGGDRTMMIWGVMGRNLEGKKTLLVTGYQPLFHDASDTKMTRSEQIVKQFKEKCESLGVLPQYAGFDASGAGKPFGDVIQILWSREVLWVDFNGKASDMAVSAYDSTPAHDRYCNRVTELWYGGHEYFRTGQIKGITREMANEMCQRKKTEEKGQFLRMRVETKPEMKARMDNASPDLSDAFFILVETCRQRLGFDSGTVVRDANATTGTGPTFKELFRKMGAIYNPPPQTAMGAIVNQAWQ